MSKNWTRDELLEYIDGLVALSGTKKLEAYQQIKEMIQNRAEEKEIEVRYMEIILDLYDRLEKKPRITEEWIEEWNKTLLIGYKLTDIHGDKDYTFALKQMLREAGVEVVESASNARDAYGGYREDK